MKTITLITLLLLSFTFGYAQQNPGKTGKSITVKGTAEKEIIPDIIYFRIALKEYKDGSRKININHLEEELVKAVKKLGIPEDKLQVENVYGYNWNPKKKQSDEFLATKSYIITLNDLKQINKLLASLDPEGINSSGVNGYTHSKIEQYKLDLKVEALKTAKLKATYLLGSIDKKLGDVMEIEEIDYGNAQPVYARSMAKFEADTYESNLEFQSIKINAEIRAVFAIE